MPETRLRRDVSVNVASNLVLGVLGVASGSLVSYRLGAGPRGALGVAQVLSALAASIGTLGFGDAVLHYTAKGSAPSPRTAVRGLLAVALLAGALGSASGAAVGCLWDGDMDIAELALFGGLVACSTSGFFSASGLMRGFGMFAGWNVARIAAALAWIAALVLTSWSSLHAVALAAVYSLVLAAVAVVQYMVARKRLRLASERRHGAPTRSQLLRFGLPSMLAAAPLVLNARVDQIGLGLVESPRVVGEYVAAAGYCWTTVPLGQAIAALSATRVAGSDNPEVVLRRLLRVGTAAIMLSVALAWLAAPVALRALNGAAFAGAVPISRILLVGTAIQGVTFILEESARGLGQPRLALRAELIGLAVMIPLLVVATRHGPKVTALASNAGYFASGAVATIGVARILKLGPVQMFLRPRPEALQTSRERQSCTNDLP